jgi:hypothetical protein
MRTYFVDILFDLFEALDPETLALISTAKSAPIVRATYRDLENQAVCLAGRPEDHPFVFHFEFSFFFEGVSNR